MKIDDIIISRYLTNDLTKEELVSFESELDHNTELSDKVKEYKSVAQGLHDFKLNEKLSGFYEKHFEQTETQSDFQYENQNKNRNFYYISGIAASLVLIIAVAIVFLYRTEVSTNELYLSYFEPLPDLDVASRGDVSELKEAFENYNAGNYAQALALLDVFPESNENHEKIMFYAAMCQMMLKNNEAAKQLLNAIPQSSIYVEQLNWYLGLVFLKEDNKQEAIKYFSKIKAHEFKYKEAIELIDQIK